MILWSDIVARIIELFVLAGKNHFCCKSLDACVLKVCRRRLCTT